MTNTNKKNNNTTTKRTRRTRAGGVVLLDEQRELRRPRACETTRAEPASEVPVQELFFVLTLYTWILLSLQNQNFMYIQINVHICLYV